MIFLIIFCKNLHNHMDKLLFLIIVFLCFSFLVYFFKDSNFSGGKVLTRLSKEDYINLKESKKSYFNLFHLFLKE